MVRETAALLGEITEDGFVFRVDLRLRPFGQSGKPALPFPAMEQYFQREGRDWERYAWLKARPVAGDLAAGAAFLELLRPFVYRRYLDYPAIDALREMKAQIDLEVQRQDLRDDIKLGPGGIREIEFLVQVVQLVRGGRDPSLRRRGLLPALAACADAGYIAPATAAMLREAYLFLRQLENRLQMLRDSQTQALPEAELDRARIALALGHADWPTLAAALAGHRERVAAEFAQVLAPRQRDGGEAPAAMLALWRALAEDRAGPVQIGAAGLAIGEALHDRLRALARSPGVQALSARARDRLDRLMATLLDRLRGAPEQDDEAAATIVELLHVLLRRSNYLALLAQQPRALERLFALARGSRWLVRRLVEQPLLLDDVFDPGRRRLRTPARSPRSWRAPPPPPATTRSWCWRRWPRPAPACTSGSAWPPSTAACRRWRSPRAWPRSPAACWPRCSGWRWPTPCAAMAGRRGQGLRAAGWSWSATAASAPASWASPPTSTSCSCSTTPSVPPRPTAPGRSRASASTPGSCRS